MDILCGLASVRQLRGQVAGMEMSGAEERLKGRQRNHRLGKTTAAEEIASCKDPVWYSDF